MKNLVRTALATSVLLLAISAGAQRSSYPAPLPSDQPHAARIRDLRGWCENIATQLRRTLSQTTRVGASDGYKAQRLISEAHRILSQNSPMGADVTPHTIDALQAGIRYVDAVAAASRTQTGVHQRTKDKVLYRSAVESYELAINAFNQLDRPYYFDYMNSCYSRYCDYSNEAYFDGLRKLSIDVLDLYTKNSEALANDYIELQAAKSSVESARYFLDASEFRRRFACEIEELMDIEAMVSGWSYNDPQYANPGAIYVLRDSVRDVRRRISYKGCGGGRWSRHGY